MTDSFPTMSAEQPRFVLLHHTMQAAGGRSEHWDLMLEHDGTLITFELGALPSGACRFQTRRLSDHRLAYLEYEGPISGNRGQVSRIDRGTYFEVNCDQADLESNGRIGCQYRLGGDRLQATIATGQAIFQLPLGESIVLEALRWELRD